MRRSRGALGLLAALATTAAMVLLTGAPAQASWRGPGPTDANWRCGTFSFLTDLKFQECAARFPSTNADYVQSVLLVTNTGTTARAVTGTTETFAGAGQGRHLAYGDCGARVIAAGDHQWCYGKTEPVAKGTPIYGIGELRQAGEYSFAYSPTPFTAPIPPTPPPPPPPCTDCDGDGFPATVDCVDNGPTIHPGSVDVPGNGVDEDCSGADAPVPVLDTSIRFGFDFRKRHTVFTRLSVQPAPAGSTIRVSCAGGGCPFKTRTRAVAQHVPKLNLLALLKRAKLRPRARLEVQVTKPGTIGRSRVFTIRTSRRPRETDRCLPPGEEKPVACPA